jgi:RNA polymerase sigma-70 factor (ECF subfamily)
LASEQELNEFLRSVEKRAFKRAVFAVRDEEAALDIVQDAMMRLAEHYADRPAAELPLLFQRIVSNATLDWFRRQKVQRGVMRNLSEFEGNDDDEDFDLLETLHAVEGSLGTESAADTVSRHQTLKLIEAAVQDLPDRQREAFLLRYWEEFDVAETAAVMGCSEGSVKTHCSRAVQALARALRDRGML